MNVTHSPSRLVSLDALRGFDMFWILGADALARALSGLSSSPASRFVGEQLDHKAWAGFAFYDLIFPLFVFIVGVSTVFSLTALISREGRAVAVRRVLRRAGLLFVLGIFYNGGLAEPWPDVRIVGVLQRIAIAYAATGLLFCYLKPRAIAAVAGALLVGYWALLTFVPIRDVKLDHATLAAQVGVQDPAMTQVETLFDATTSRVTGRFDPGLNLTNHIDFLYLPGRMYDRYYDPEGLLSMLPAIATCILGVFAGLVLRRVDFNDTQKLRVLLISGVAALIVGWLWHLQFPVIKKLWTSSYVLVAGGWSFLLLAGFYYIVDVRKRQRWCQPLVWIGMNPITLYLATSVVSFHAIGERLAGGSVSEWLDVWLVRGAGGIIVTVIGLAAMFALAGFLYRRKIFLRV